MAIIEKDGFDFISDMRGNPEALIIKGDNLSKEVKYINKNRIKSIYLTFFKSKAIENLDFLKETNCIEKVNFNDIDIDYSGLYNLQNLKQAILSVKNKKHHLDFSRFKLLEYLSIDWYSQFPNLSTNENLKELVIWKFKPKSKMFSELQLPASLELLQITDSNILDFSGLNLASLKVFEGHHCNSLVSLAGIKNLNSSLNAIILDNCKKLVDYSELESCKQLDKIILGNCGDIASLKWLKTLSNVKHFSFWNTNLIDGDTSPCFGIKYVSFKNAKHYNHKKEEFTPN